MKLNSTITVASLFLAGMLFWGSPVNALSRRGKSNLRNVKSTIQITGLKVIKPYEKGPVSRAVTRHYKNLKSNLGRVIRTFNRIKGTDRNDPKVVRVGNLLRRLSIHFQIIKRRTKNKGASDQAAKNLHFAFKKRFGGVKYSSIINKLNNINLDPKRDVLSFLLRAKPMAKARRRKRKSSWRKSPGNSTAVGGPFAKFKAGILEIKTACNGRFRAIKNHRHYSMGISSEFGTWCILVNKSDKLIRIGISAAVNSVLRFPLRQLDDAVDSMLNKKGFITTRSAQWILYPQKYRNELQQIIAGYGAVAGVTLDDTTVLATWDSAVVKAKQILNKSAKSHKMKDVGYKHRYSKVKRMVKKNVRNNWKKGIKFKKVRMYRKGWLIVKNRLTSIPLRRSRAGAVLYRVRGEKWCRLRTFEYREPYLGAGRYARKGNFSYSESIRLQKCK
jgi:hypothetical protein